MYICLCRAITEDDIKQAVLEGKVTCIASLQSHLGVSTQCGSCLECAKSCLAELQATVSHQTPIPTKILSTVDS